jgi:hypothetical protein
MIEYFENEFKLKFEGIGGEIPNYLKQLFVDLKDYLKLKTK